MKFMKKLSLFIMFLAIGAFFSKNSYSKEKVPDTHGGGPQPQDHVRLVHQLDPFHDRLAPLRKHAVDRKSVV